jgi:signal transduction histidine kinase
MTEATLREAQILLIDDDVSSTCLMTNFLNRIGYSRLESVNDSTRAFAMIETLKPDLILLDLAMPGLTGFEILNSLRTRRSGDEQTPVLVLTGDASSENKRKALAAGATDLLVKPFDASEVSMRIRNLLQARFLRLEIQEQNQLLEQRVHERTIQLETALADLHNAQHQLVQQERLSAFGEMAAGVVHDFSNTLMAVIGYSDILIAANGRNLDKRETALEYLQIINTAGRDAAEVVSRLRDFYRPRNQTDSAQEVDLNEIVRQAVRSTQPKWQEGARESGARITVEVERNDLPIVHGNPAELREMLTNLIFNAVDAMPDGGKVKIRTRQLDDHVVIEVSDDGAGMTPEVRARCLDPFFSTKGDKGTGLGLAMVCGIVQRHEGTLEIDSEPGCGATFRIILPAHEVYFVEKNSGAENRDPLVAA